MGFIKAVKQFWTKSFSTQLIGLREQDSTLFTLLGQDYRFGTESKDFLLKAYGMNPYVFMVIDRIVQRLVQAEKVLIGKGDKEVVDPDFQNLLDKPNNKETGDALLYRFAATYLATGEAFMVRRQELGEDDQYFVPINYNVIINQDIDGNILTYWVTMFGKSETYLPGEVLHILKPDITYDTNRGFSTLRATRRVWESNNEVWGSEATLHKNKGITGVLYSDGNRPMTPKEEKDLQGQYDTDYTGRNNFGKVKVSTSKLGYIPMGMNPNDLKSIETRLEHLRTICASFNVDSKLFGDSAASTYNNMAEAQRAFIVNAVLPLSKIVLPAMVAFIARSQFKSYYLEIDENEIIELQITKEQKSARIGREVVQGILSPGEAREMLYPELAANQEGRTARPTATQTNLSIQDLLSLQSSVTSGATTREGALALLVQIYGFDEQTANDILG